MKRVRLIQDVDYARDRFGNIIAKMGTTCTTLDHIFRSNPNKHGIMRPETKCYCGARRWGGTGKPILGSASRTDGEAQTFTVRIKRQTAESPATKETVMAKKAAAKKSTGTRAWKRIYEFVKPLKAEPPKGTIKSAVYHGIKSIKHGDADAVTAAAEKAGLKDATDQDPRVQTMVWLRALIADGAVKVKAADKPAPTAADASKKTVRVKLRKTAA